MLDKFQISHLRQLLEEGYALKEIARIMGISINTAQIPPQHTHSKPRQLSGARMALEAHRDEVQELFVQCGGNCKAMLERIEGLIGARPSLRLLQHLCAPFRTGPFERKKRTAKEQAAPGLKGQAASGNSAREKGGKQA